MAKKLHPVFVGIVNDDPCVPSKLRIDDKSEDAFVEYLKKFKDGEKVKVTITRLTKSKIRSLEQNGYYWGVVLKILAEEFGYIGPSEKEELHDSLRCLFLVRTGKMGLKVVESTTKLDTDLFERYLEAVRNWALSEYQIKIPKPNEVEESDDYEKI